MYYIAIAAFVLIGLLLISLVCMWAYGCSSKVCQESKLLNSPIYINRGSQSSASALEKRWLRELNDNQAEYILLSTCPAFEKNPALFVALFAKAAAVHKLSVSNNDDISDVLAETCAIMSLSKTKSS